MAQSKKNGKTNRTGRTAKQKRMPRYEADSLAAWAYCCWRRAF